MGLFDRLKQRLGKTREALSDSLSGLFRGGRAMDDALLDELEEVLYTSDLGPLAVDLVATSQVGALLTRLREALPDATISLVESGSVE